MGKSFRWRLTWSYGLIIVVFFSLAGILVGEVVSNSLVKNLGLRLQYEAQLISDLIPEGYDWQKPTEAMEEIARRAGKDTRVRITVVGKNGTVLADSRTKAEKLPNHGGRPEIAAALRGETSQIVRYSTTVKTDMMYVAVPIEKKNEVVGVVRLSLPLEEVKGLVADIWRIVAIITALGALLAFLVSVRVAKKMAEPLSEMTETAIALTQGDLKRRIRVETQDEIGELAKALNQMASRLDRQIEELTQTKTRLEIVLTNTVNGVVLLDKDKKVVYVNPEAKRMLKLDSHSFDLKSYLEVLPVYALAEAVQLACEKGEAVKREVVLFDKGERAVEANVIPIMSGGNGVLVILNDITELKRLEKVRRDFVANVSHELKTPVSAISGWAETLMWENKENHAVYEGARIIHEEAGRLAKMVETLLDLSRLESQDPGLVKSEVQIKTLIHNTVERFLPQAQQRGISVKLSFPEEETLVWADRERITQVMSNLLDNAIKHSPENGTITIKVTKEQGKVMVEVIDEGVGMAEEEAGRVFERFYRVDKARTRKEGGAGLGLAIVKHIIEAHGGEIGVRTSLGKGSNFYFTLPTPN